VFIYSADRKLYCLPFDSTTAVLPARHLSLASSLSLCRAGTLCYFFCMNKREQNFQGHFSIKARPLHLACLSLNIYNKNGNPIIIVDYFRQMKKSTMQQQQRLSNATENNMNNLGWLQSHEQKCIFSHIISNQSLRP
jgi:hypothetical protein